MAFVCRLHLRYCRRLHLEFHRPSTAMLLVAGADAGPQERGASCELHQSHWLALSRSHAHTSAYFCIPMHTYAYIRIHVHTCAYAVCMRFDHFTGSSARTFVPDRTQPSRCDTTTLHQHPLWLGIFASPVFGYGTMPNEDGASNP